MLRTRRCGPHSSRSSRRCAGRCSSRRFSCSRPAGQAHSVLHIKVVLVDAERKATPVPRHALLVSDNPATAPPRRIVTALDGTADVRLRPGNYTVESDQPVAFQRQGLPVDADGGHRRRPRRGPRADSRQRGGRARHAGDDDPRRSPEADPSFLLPQWQDSVVALWTPTTHASGFVVDAKGLIATNQRVIGTATSVEVQLTPARQGGGARPRGRSRAGCRRPLDRSEGRRIGAARAARMRAGGEAARRGRAGDLHDRRAAP